MSSDLSGRLGGPAMCMLDGLQRAALRSWPLFEFLGRHPGSIPDRVSAARAIRAADVAVARVPAYRDFLGASGWAGGSGSPAERLARLPETDKRTYIDAYPTGQRCLDGVIPLRDVEVDESSGSSGKPYSWVRGRAELAQLHRTLSHLTRHLFGQDLVVLNGFSMGAWATGTNVAAALADNGVIKSPGPDVEKILSAFELLGHDRTYLVTGYPPFLRQLLDAGDQAGFDWGRFRMYGVVGGEAMSEALRGRLEQRFMAVYSAYGASDLDIGIAAELPIAVWVRQAAAADPALARALFGDDSRLPMLFQYNPTDYYVETNHEGELVVTVNRPCVLSPRIRYNVHDAGGTLPFRQVVETCRDFGLDALAGAAARSAVATFRLPFLFVRGRSDSTMSYMGANIYPEDVERALFSGGPDADHLGAFCLELLEAGDRPRPCVHVEVNDGVAHDPGLASRLSHRIRECLMAASRDFAEAAAEDADHGDILVRLHEPGGGPFAENAGRIKRRYIVR